MARVQFVAPVLVCGVLFGSVLSAFPGVAAADVPGSMSSHRTIKGVVLSERSGLLTVKTESGTQLSIAANASGRHGHRVPKVGEAVTLTMDENNAVIDVHPSGQEGTHQFVTGKLKYLGKMKPEIKLETAEGDKTFPLDRQEVKTGTIEEGALVTAELNEAGTVIDLHRAERPH
jgi:hypothetical protein